MTLERAGGARGEDDPAEEEVEGVHGGLVRVTPREAKMGRP
jgi:hypothetical protein